ncbi:hypothetical protein IAG41_15465 [Sphingomonas sp. JC676]|uniref:hypothetical protein n=1 Tax=Sphingomonas sp. JC676 TaxID=2768065 RepID=UPI00165770D7|nr:hypothetical protein [Sphingomonas sp. JC676]MBC9033794.1 hypothetical protein [Sphingomonas sp. JC676]
MHTILVMISSVGLVIGGLAAAAALCWLLWQLFAQIRHPDWAPSIILVLAGFGMTGNLPDSQFLHVALAYALAAAIPLWMEGRAWRRHRAIEVAADPGVTGL